MKKRKVRKCAEDERELANRYMDAAQNSHRTMTDEGDHISGDERAADKVIDDMAAAYHNVDDVQRRRKRQPPAQHAEGDEQGPEYEPGDSVRVSAMMQAKGKAGHESSSNRGRGMRYRVHDDQAGVPQGHTRVHLPGGEPFVVANRNTQHDAREHAEGDRPEEGEPYEPGERVRYSRSMQDKGKAGYGPPPARGRGFRVGVAQDQSSLGPNQVRIIDDGAEGMGDEFIAPSRHLHNDDDFPDDYAEGDEADDHLPGETVRASTSMQHKGKPPIDEDSPIPRHRRRHYGSGRGYRARVHEDQSGLLPNQVRVEDVIGNDATGDVHEMQRRHLQHDATPDAPDYAEDCETGIEDDRPRLRRYAAGVALAGAAKARQGQPPQAQPQSKRRTPSPARRGQQGQVGTMVPLLDATDARQPPPVPQRKGPPPLPQQQGRTPPPPPPGRQAPPPPPAQEPEQVQQEPAPSQRSALDTARDVAGDVRKLLGRGDQKRATGAQTAMDVAGDVAGAVGRGVKGAAKGLIGAGKAAWNASQQERESADRGARASKQTLDTPDRRQAPPAPPPPPQGKRRTPPLSTQAKVPYTPQPDPQDAKPKRWWNHLGFAEDPDVDIEDDSHPGPQEGDEVHVGASQHTGKGGRRGYVASGRQMGVMGSPIRHVRMEGGGAGSVYERAIRHNVDDVDEHAEDDTGSEDDTPLAPQPRRGRVPMWRRALEGAAYWLGPDFHHPVRQALRRTTGWKPGERPAQWAEDEDVDIEDDRPRRRRFAEDEDNLQRDLDYAYQALDADSVEGLGSGQDMTPERYEKHRANILSARQARNAGLERRQRH